MKTFKIIPHLYIALALLVQLDCLCIGSGYFNNMIGIYMLKWDKGYFYIGQSQNLKERQTQHICRLKKSTHNNKYLQRVYDKYGKPEFVILEHYQIQELDVREQSYLDQHFHNRKCCNNSPNASSCRGLKWSEESKDKLRQRKLGTTQSEEQKEKARQFMNKKYAEGYKVKPMKGKLNGFYKKKHDLIAKIIMFDKKQGIYDGGKNPRARLVLNIETGIYYDTIREASETISHYKESTVRNQITGYKKNTTSLIIVQK